MAAKKSFDIIVFGATGFTGKHCVKELAEIWDENPDLKWAVAGRNMEKLQASVEWASDKSGRDLQQVGYVCADVGDEASLNSMCQQGKLILNVVGPYQLYGRPVVEACLRNKCHHVDISGETQFLEKVQLDYHERAKAAGVYIMQACGYDSIPTDMGVIFVKNKFPGILNSVESYMSTDSGPEGFTINTGSLLSMLLIAANFAEIKEIREKLNLAPLPECKPKLNTSELKAVRKELNHAPLPECKPKLHTRKSIFYSDFIEKWSAPMLGSIPDTTEQSQRYFYHQEKERPVQFSAYMSERSLPKFLGQLLMFVALMIIGIFKCGRSLIEKYPEYITFGLFSHKGPTEAQMARTSFTFKSRGRGFSTEAAANEGKEDLEIITQVNGPEMGYVTTPIVMIQAALTVLQETDKLPDKGGVYSPGAAFHKTTLINRCHEHGVKFTVIKDAYKV